MKPLAVGAVGVAVAVVGALWFFTPRGQPEGVVLRTDDAAVLARGQALYAQHCAACHGAQLQGQPNWRERNAQGLLPAPPHDASGHTWHHPDAVLFDITKHGVAKAARMPDYVSAMPAYAGVLSDEEIVAVLSWIRSTWPSHIQRQHEAVNASARSR
ncbi:c-type cytochrome [Ramlibacter rhizophilus]|uniref:C-type cytochrome n=1 Tax=Ramlibacter rhizophilus TaxID=1781167 RepID=A0A4Z0BR70_9BURK|nr:c-type cytochrome [Ramlibacter rhizophilus]TFZ01321.1 c-type cytochrome [Ramlibacter rhizophilus]